MPAEIRAENTNMRISAKRIIFRGLLPILIFLTFTVVSAEAKNEKLKIDHKVGIESFGEQTYRVTTTIRNVETDTLKIFFPMYRPGIYTTYYYLKNMGGLSITDGSGRKLSYEMSHLQTFLIDTKNVREIKITFYYKGTKLSGNEAYLDNDSGFFTGVQFFAMVDDKRSIPAAVTFDLPADWKILTTLETANNGQTYEAKNYDLLADSQTMIGKFDLTEFDVLGKPHYIATTPIGWYSAENTAKLKEKLNGIIETQNGIFGELPYDKYLFLYVFKAVPEGNNSIYLEEVQSANSHLQIVEPTAEESNPEQLLASAIHNHFHVWSLMRMRPVENWNWDYTRNTDSRLLWLTEGITRYYMTVTRLRSRNGTDKDFISRVTESINGVELNPSRNILSPGDGSMLSQVRFSGALETDYSFTLSGHIIGFLLDLSIRHDTNGKYSLDDVMRTLYRETYKKDRGYTEADFQNIIEKLTGKSYREFFDKYVNGTEIPPYDTYLGYAGYKVVKNTSERPVLGLLMDVTPEGALINRVSKGTAADVSGLHRKDIILTFGNLDVVKNGLTGAGQLVSQNIGKTIPLKVKRGNGEIDIQLQIKNQEQIQYQVVEVDSPTAAQLKLRKEWLKQ